MALPTNTSLPFALQQIQALSQQLKSYANGAFQTLQNTTDANFIFEFMDRFYNTGAALNQWASTPGLNAYATSNIPNYTGTMTADINATVTAGQNVINWIVANFPKDSQGFAQAYTLNADGSRTAAQFSAAATAPLRTLIQTFMGTIN